MPIMPAQCNWDATSGYELVLATGLRWRPDRPTRIPLPANTTIAIRRYTGTGSKPLKIDGVAQATVWLNNTSLSKHKDLLSRAHAELTVQHGMLCIRDGNPREGILSTNGTAVNGELVPLGGAAAVTTESTIVFGVPHLIPFNPSIKRAYQKLRPEFKYTFKKVENVTQAPVAPPQVAQAPARPARVARRTDKRVTRAMSQPIAKRTRQSLRSVRPLRK